MCFRALAFVLAFVDGAGKNQRGSWQCKKILGALVLRLAGSVGTAALLLLSSVSAFAGEPRNMLYVGLGGDDIFDGSKAAVLDAEWRPAVRYWDIVAPLAGGFVTSEGSLYGYVGFGFDVSLTDTISVMPFTGAGLYSEGGGPDLGQALEFRSGLELSYTLGGGTVVAAQLYHLSNASLADRNPGNNYAVIRYGVPLETLAALVP
jgi:lipid A 3-O-deacylase